MRARSKADAIAQTPSPPCVRQRFGRWSQPLSRSCRSTRLKPLSARPVSSRTAVSIVGSHDQSAGRVEDGRGCLGHMASPRLPSPLIKLDVRVSRIQLSDRFHREAHDVALVARGACAASSNIFASRHSPFRQVRLFGCLQAKGQSPQHLRRHERTRSQGPFLRRRYPASSVIRPCPNSYRKLHRRLRAVTVAKFQVTLQLNRRPR